MNCYIHEQNETIGTCVGCGKFICKDCNTEINGKNYCKSCLTELFNERNREIDELKRKSNQNSRALANATYNTPIASSSASEGSVICTKSKTTAGVLAILFGGFGVHKFYLGSMGFGVLYLLFCWTGIPFFVSFIEGILILSTSDNDFNSRYGYILTKDN